MTFLPLLHYCRTRQTICRREKSSILSSIGCEFDVLAKGHKRSRRRKRKEKKGACLPHHYYLRSLSRILKRERKGKKGAISMLFLRADTKKTSLLLLFSSDQRKAGGGKLLSSLSLSLITGRTVRRGRKEGGMYPPTRDVFAADWKRGGERERRTSSPPPLIVVGAGRHAGDKRKKRGEEKKRRPAWST